MEKYIPCKWEAKESWSSNIHIRQINLKIKKITRDKKGHYIMIKGYITIVNIYVKKAECWRMDAFELWCWRRLLRVPWTERRSNQSILKEISPECSLEGLILKLKLQYFGHLSEELTHWIRLWCWERFKAGREGDNRGWDSWMASSTQWTWV